MDLSFTPGELAFRDECRSFFREEFPQALRRKVLDGQHLSKDEIVTAHRLLNAKGWATPHWPIAWGGKMDYPYARARGHIRQVYDRFGPDKLIWGSDMPNVGRYCTYKQALGYVWDYCEFLTPVDRRKIFRENTLSLFKPPA